ncbi:MAG: response regulator [Acidobacteriota bacterium]
MPARELRRILYVEDEPDIQTVAKLSLESLGGFVLEVCSSGAEAIEKGPAFGPDLILLDVMMPGMDGPTTLQRLREAPPLSGVPAVFMTAKAQPQEIQQFLALGAADVITKPFDPMALPATVRAIWERTSR